jgi:hypothetical protein
MYCRRCLKDDNKPLLCCPGCKTPLYCSKLCLKGDWPYHKRTCSVKPKQEEIVNPFVAIKLQYEKWITLAQTNLCHLAYATIGGSFLHSHACIISLIYTPDNPESKFQVFEVLSVDIENLEHANADLYQRLHQVTREEQSAPIVIRIRIKDFPGQELVLIADFVVSDRVILEHGAMPVGVTVPEYRKLMIEFTNVGTFTGHIFPNSLDA